jgi:hypothetical protein
MLVARKVDNEMNGNGKGERMPSETIRKANMKYEQIKN